MDVEYPFASGSARLQLLYRLPTAPAPARLLIVGPAHAGTEADTEAAAEAALIGEAWPGAVTHLEPAALALLTDGCRFEAVVLPRAQALSASTHAGRAGRDALLHAVQRLLVPGGVVVGHLDNIGSVQHLKHWRAVPTFLRSAVGRGEGAAKLCVRGLNDNGFSGAECYYVQPSIASAMGLIPCAPVAARAQFLRSLRASRGQYGRAAYGLRWLVASAGFAGMLQPELFFWAKKAC